MSDLGLACTVFAIVMVIGMIPIAIAEVKAVVDRERSHTKWLEDQKL